MTPSGIQVVSTTDRGYLPAACCQLLSVADHLPSPDAARLTLVLCDVAPPDVDEARRLFDHRGVAVEIVVAQDVAERIRIVDNRWPRAAYLRLYFDEILGDGAGRLVYFDADTRIRRPLAPLLTADLHGRPIGAVHDFIYYVTGNIRRRRRELGLAPDAPYFQSGVMVFDWPAMLRDGGLARARDFLAAHPEACHEAPDQDALNAAMENRWTPLDPRWNLHELYLMFGGTERPFIEHYTSTKPWSRRRPAAWREAAAWYRAELRDTAWSDFIPHQTAGDRAMARIDFLKFRYKPKLRDALARRAPFMLDAMGVGRVRDEAKELPWAPRNRRIVEDMTAALIAEAEGRCPPLRPPESPLAGYGV